MRKPSDREANEGIFRLDPEYGQMAVRMGEAVWGIKALSQREKALLCLMMDICDHNLGLAFQMHVEMALANSVPLSAIKEVIFQAALEAGYTNALQALVRFHEIRAELKDASVDAIVNDGATDFGVDEPGGARMEALDPAFAALWRTRMAEQWSRPHLSHKERAYLSLAADVSNQTLGTPFGYHVRTALQHGAAPEDVRAIVRFIAEFGFSKAWQALEALRPILNETDE